ncbi:MarR family winged helix-turn-helix transcriptional regulator [Saccharibacillus sp. JS10]|uniref:MarR family winged helix-turn-helix transcriptional regulator n=1 Tax=Saccharibacillus sp. JS10 TaxID=2950552 RepID=UPI002108DA57|nr:MarR family transcriptional regulator [Saccharibacillus sp. JS10]MCQ4085441.1 MarR family transcriptional regulator [Saccharibacillus sp. JS10]
MSKQEQLLEEFGHVFNKLVWLNRGEMEEKLKGHKSSEVHCIEYIGKHEDSNVTKLADAFYMTRGAISKITKKLLDKGLIESYQSAENKKEIYFKLTPQGQEVFEIHEGLHQSFRERDDAVFEHISDAQYETIFHFLDLYRQHLDHEIHKQGITPEDQIKS